MTEYTASNGVTVSSETQQITGYRRIIFTAHGKSETFELSGPFATALIDSLDAEKDHDLGRWRWPENPDYVVMDVGLNFVKILHEPSMETTVWERGWKDTRSVADEAGVAYFEAHPERKPWEDAQPGEVWELTYVQLGETQRVRPFTVDSFRRFHDTAGVVVGELDITAGRRIWPEDAS